MRTNSFSYLLFFSAFQKTITHQINKLHSAKKLSLFLSLIPKKEENSILVNTLQQFCWIYPKEISLLQWSFEALTLSENLLILGRFPETLYEDTLSWTEPYGSQAHITVG